MLPSVRTLPGNVALRTTAVFPNHDTESTTVVIWLSPLRSPAHMKWLSARRPTQRTVMDALCVVSRSFVWTWIVSGRL